MSLNITPYFHEETKQQLSFLDITSQISSFGPSVGYIVSKQLQDQLAHSLGYRPANAGGGGEEDDSRNDVSVADSLESRAESENDHVKMPKKKSKKKLSSYRKHKKSSKVVEPVPQMIQVTRTDPYDVADFDPLLFAMMQAYAKEMANMQLHLLTGNQQAHSMKELVTNAYRYRLTNAGEEEDSRNDVSMADSLRSMKNESRTKSENDHVKTPQSSFHKHKKSAFVEHVPEKYQVTRADPYEAEFDPYLFATRRVFAKEMANARLILGDHHDVVTEKIMKKDTIPKLCAGLADM
jgi:hypothetical protein